MLCKRYTNHRQCHAKCEPHRGRACNFQLSPEVCTPLSISINKGFTMCTLRFRVHILYTQVRSHSIIMQNPLSARDATYFLVAGELAAKVASRVDRRQRNRAQIRRLHFCGSPSKSSSTQGRRSGILLLRDSCAVETHRSLGARS